MELNETLNGVLLVCAALLPAIVLCIYIFKKDSVDKEPVLLLLSLLAVGVAICYPAAEIESVFNKLLAKLFAPLGKNIGGTVYLSGVPYRLYHACKYFIGVALVEEGLKFVAMCFVTGKNKNFNSLFDGLVYAVFVSLGFAALENVLYVRQYGWINALARGVLSVPGHMFFGVIMGYYYSLWHMHEKAKNREQILKRAGYIAREEKEFSGTYYLVMSLLVPVLAHGMYDFCCTNNSLLSTLAFYGFIVYLYIYCFTKIRNVSRFDMRDSMCANALLQQKYPHLKDALQGDLFSSEEQTESPL